MKDTSFKTRVVESMIRIAQWGTSNHVLDDIKIAVSINDSAILLSGLKLRESNINGDTQHPNVLEGPLVHLSSFLVEPLDHTLVNTTIFTAAIVEPSKNRREILRRSARHSQIWWSRYGSSPVSCNSPSLKRSTDK